MTLHDVWYLSVETSIAGELRGFSRQIRARPVREGIPRPVHEICESFLAECLEGSDVHTCDAVLAGEAFDYPYRFASYHLQRNGNTVVRSFAFLPVKPCVLT